MCLLRVPMPSPRSLHAPVFFLLIPACGMQVSTGSLGESDFSVKASSDNFDPTPSLTPRSDPTPTQTTVLAPVPGSNDSENDGGASQH